MITARLSVCLSVCVCVGTSVDLSDVVLPSGLVVEMFTPYNMLTDWPLGTSHNVTYHYVPLLAVGSTYTQQDVACRPGSRSGSRKS